MPVYVLLIGAFIPSETLWGPLGFQGLTMFLLFLAGIVAAMLYAWVMKRTLLKSNKAPFIHELPTYKMPTPGYVYKQLSQKTKAFLKKAGTLIMGISVVLWLLSSYPKPPENSTESAVTYSIAGKMGMALEPIFEPLGFDWRITTGLIPGFAAREVMVGALGTVFAVEDAEESGFDSLQSTIQETWSLASGLSLLVWYIFAPQCLATFAVAKKEMGGWKWPAFMFLFFLASAYFFSFITFQITSAIIS
jgi:ferrous iron transport protein B